MDKNINIGIIGCGHLGKLHLKNIKELTTERNDISIKGIYDIDKNKAKELAKENQVVSFDNLNGMLNEINTAIIVSPTSTHLEIASETINQNINSFIEKPVTDNLENAYELKNLSLKSKSVIQVGHIERFNPALLSVEKFDIKPLFIETHRLAQFNPRGTDVSVIQDLMIHDIDIILNLVKSKVKNIEANGVAIMTDKFDIANARLQFENGCVANITASRISQKKMRKMRIFQSDAYISVDFSENNSEVFKLSENISGGLPFGSIVKNDIKYNIIYDKPKVSVTNAMKYELNLFFNCIINKSKPVVTLEDGIQALEVATEIIKKINESSKYY